MLLQQRMAHLGIAYQARVKSLGVGMGGGRRRNAQVLTSRLLDFRRRLPRWQRLRRSGVDTHRLLRTGGKAALTYGCATTGVSNTMLARQRRAAALAAAPANGSGGQHTDMALVMADGGLSGKADPAFDAHEQPIGQWSMACWELWLPACSLLHLAAKAKAALLRPGHIWARVRGPGAAMVASCARLGWSVTDAFSLVTDQGKLLHLRIDPQPW